MSQQEPDPSKSSPAKPQSSVTQPADPALKVTTIKALRALIRSLEGLVQRFESDPAESGTFAKLQKLLEKLGRLWQKLLRLVRDRLPAELNQKLSDRILSGILAGAFVILFWFTSSIFSPKPAPTIATRPPIEAAPQPAKPIPPTFEVAPQPSEPFPTDLSAPEPLPEPEVLTSEPEAIAEEPEVLTPEPEDAAEVSEVTRAEDASEEILEVEQPIEIASEPEATVIEPEPIEPEPIAIAPEPVAPEPPPVPEIELTPEQKMIASVQAQIVEVSDQFISGLVDSVMPDFLRQRLTVKVTPDWFRFNDEQQDRFANEVWQRSQSLDFTKLEITAPNGSLLARNPVVGNSMVILKRK